jgi:hypothetical protein
MSRRYQVHVTLKTRVEIELDQDLTHDPSPEQRIACWEAVCKVIEETEVAETDVSDILVILGKEFSGKDLFTECDAGIRAARKWLEVKHP